MSFIRQVALMVPTPSLLQGPNTSTATGRKLIPTKWLASKWPTIILTLETVSMLPSVVAAPVIAKHWSGEMTVISM